MMYSIKETQEADKVSTDVIKQLVGCGVGPRQFTKRFITHEADLMPVLKQVQMFLVCFKVSKLFKLQNTL